jgi:hypothetical protein
VVLVLLYVKYEGARGAGPMAHGKASPPIQNVAVDAHADSQIATVSCHKLTMQAADPRKQE